MAQKRSKNQLRREKAKLRKLQGSKADVSTDTKVITNSIAADNINELERKKENQVNGESEIDRSIGSEIENRLQDETKKEDLAQKNTVKDEPTNSNMNTDELLADNFRHIFAKFNEQAPIQDRHQLREAAASSIEESSTDEDSSDDEIDKPLSRRQLRKRNKVSIAELKASTHKPSAVAWYDADAPDPYLCVALKTSFNAINVPAHWQQKKEYLSGKKGIELLPYQLPKYIRDTGIAEMRNYDPESLKKSQRERVQPKMGKLDIDYQKLYDAFFKYQTKPSNLRFGELYWEGREKAERNRESVFHIRPGVVSKRLKEAVGISLTDNQSVPPWITLMNLLGKPPSFRDCIIPGVDAPYDNNGYRFHNSNDLKHLLEQNWGSLEEAEDSEPEEESEEESEEKEEEIAEESSGENADGSVDYLREDDIKVADDDRDSEEPEKVVINEFSKYKPRAQKTNESGKLGELYKVLKEKAISGSDKDVDKKSGYDLQGESTGSEHDDKQDDAPRLVRNNNVEEFEF